MKKSLLTAFAMILLLTSCTQRGCQRFDKNMQFTERTYEVSLYSGGTIVFQDTFKGIVNGEQGTDGFYYFKQDTLIEISGDYVLRSIE